jgi:hypothetical protein
MFLKRTFSSSAIASAGALLLLMLPVPGQCQTDTGPTEDSSEPIEEIVVLGRKPIIQLLHEMYDAEEALYDTYNSLNTDDDFDIRCFKEAPTGSHLKQRICRPQKLGKILAEVTQAMMRGEPTVFPTAEIDQMNERMLAEMTELTLERPDYLDALVKFTEARQIYESERKRRCEGRFLICRKE